MRKVYLFLVLFALLGAAVTAFSLMAELGRADMVSRGASQSSLIDYYSGEPLLDKHPMIGMSEAQLTFIVIIDFQSDDSKNFYQTLMPQLIQEYVNDGEARVYHKYYITEAEYQDKTGRFKYSSAALCYYNLGGDDIQGFHESLFSRDVEATKEAYGLGKDFDDCLGQDSVELRHDTLESSTFRISSPSLLIGIDGRDNTVLHGTPSMARINRAVRYQQVKLGI